MGGIRLSLTCACAVVVASLAALATPAVAAAGTCDRVAASSGSDSATGTPGAPYRTAQKLVGALQPGETGCLRGGTYTESTTFSRAGRTDAPITLQAWPGERAVLVGRMVVTSSARFVTVQGLWLDGRNNAALPSPTVNGDDVTFRGNDVTNGHTAICFVIGASDVNNSASYGRAARTQLLGNRIHDCGVLPAANHDHGVYVEGADDARIAGNWIYGNADRGIQLYPDAQRTEITGNVLDGNGTNLIFSGDLGLAASGTTVSGNLITNAVSRFNVESWYPDGNPKGTGNGVAGNCLFGAARTDAGAAGIDASDGGFSVGGNRVADPGYVDRAAGDYRIQASSPCSASFAGDGTAVPGPDGTPIAPMPAPTPPSPAPSPAPAATPAPTPAPVATAPARRPAASPGSTSARKPGARRKPTTKRKPARQTRRVCTTKRRAAKHGAARGCKVQRKAAGRHARG